MEPGGWLWRGRSFQRTGATTKKTLLRILACQTSTISRASSTAASDEEASLSLIKSVPFVCVENTAFLSNGNNITFHTWLEGVVSLGELSCSSFVTESFINVFRSINLHYCSHSLDNLLVSPVNMTLHCQNLDICQMCCPSLAPSFTARSTLHRIYYREDTWVSPMNSYTILIKQILNPENPKWKDKCWDHKWYITKMKWHIVCWSKQRQSK